MTDPYLLGIFKLLFDILAPVMALLFVLGFFVKNLFKWI